MPCFFRWGGAPFDPDKSGQAGLRVRRLSLSKPIFLFGRLTLRQAPPSAGPPFGRLTLRQAQGSEAEPVEAGRRSLRPRQVGTGKAQGTYLRRLSISAGSIQRLSKLVVLFGKLWIRRLSLSKPIVLFSRAHPSTGSGFVPDQSRQTEPPFDRLTLRRAQGSM